MKKTWDVNVNGTMHTIEYRTGFGATIIVNGSVYKGNKVDLAVNGTYLGSQEPYQPLHKVPTLSNVLLGVSVVGGFFLCGVIGMLIGILFGTLYVKLGLKGKTGAVVGAFAGCTVIQLVIVFIVAFIQIGLYY